MTLAVTDVTNCVEIEDTRFIADALTADILFCVSLSMLIAELVPMLVSLTAMFINDADPAMETDNIFLKNPIV